MSYESERNWGCIVAASLFALLGIPFLALLSLGERVCDTVRDTPCDISWGWMQIIYLTVVLAICLAIGWLVNRTIRHRGRGE
jgi:hypothetical protein